MSGDVQPRKRKDKKRKREDESVPLAFFPKELSEDVNIHIHKEEGTGGGICAKIIFFILFSALIVLIGLIITEHRGLTDLDVADSESRYSQLFEGWVDNEKHDKHHTLDDHDNGLFGDEEGDHDDGHTLDDHDDEHIDDEPSEEEREHTLDDHDNEHFDDDDQSNLSSEEDEEATEESQDQDHSWLKSGRYRREVSEEDNDIPESQQDLDETEEEVFADSETKEDEEEIPDSEEREYIEDDDDDNLTDSQQYTQETEEEEETMADSDIKEDTEEIHDNSENENEDQTLSEEDEDKDSPSDEDEHKDSEDDEEFESVKDSQEDDKNQSPEYKDKQASDEELQQKTSETIEESNENKDDIDEISEPENVIEERVENIEAEKPTEGEPENSGVSDIPGSLSMIVKAIIGAAILAVGHFVLVKKWKSDSSDEDNEKNLGREEFQQDLSRRNTLVPPPTLQEIEQDVEYANEEYSDEEETATKEDFRVEQDAFREKYEQLRSSYSRSISPESDEGEENNITESDNDIEIENMEDVEEEEVEEEEVEEEDIEEIHEQEIEEDEDYEEEEYEDEDDDELMKKLEAKYGKLELESKGRTPSSDHEESDSEKLSDDNNDYEYSSITNEDDWHIHEDLDEAQKKLPNNAAKALKMFEKILEKYPSSPRGFYGLAQALDALAEMKKSNELLEEAVANYLRISDLTNVPDKLYNAAMERCIDRLRFRGKYGKAVTVHLKLIERYPHEPKYRNQLVITYLTINRVEKARLLLEETLQKWPDDGCALVHYGFIWKTTDNDLKKGVYYMQKGIETKNPCVIDGRFYFHLGDALFRLGFRDKALKLYEDGVEHKLFLSKYQRSLYNVPHLTARPWWETNQLAGYQSLFKELVENWQVIRNEGLSVLNEKGYFQDESENLRDTGDWKQFELFARGRKDTKHCNKTPLTCRIIESHPEASGCRRGQTKFSVMHPGTHVWAHCGPTNCRIRVHLGLKVPSRTFIRVGDDIRSWKDGKLLIFDDSFEHEVWHNGTETRLVLIVDVWHPELSKTERETLSSL